MAGKEYAWIQSVNVLRALNIGRALSQPFALAHCKKASADTPLCLVAEEYVLASRCLLRFGVGIPVG
jgi:hypothetical protein